MWNRRSNHLNIKIEDAQGRRLDHTPLQSGDLDRLLEPSQAVESIPSQLPLQNTEAEMARRDPGHGSPGTDRNTQHPRHAEASVSAMERPLDANSGALTEHFRSISSRPSAIFDAAIERMQQLEINTDLDLSPSLQETIRAVQELLGGKHQEPTRSLLRFTSPTAPTCHLPHNALPGDLSFATGRLTHRSDRLEEGKWTTEIVGEADRSKNPVARARIPVLQNQKVERSEAGVAFAIRNDLVGRLPCLPLGIDYRLVNLCLPFQGDNFAGDQGDPRCQWLDGALLRHLQNDNVTVEIRWYQLHNGIQSTTLDVLGRAHLQQQDWFDDNDADISNALREKSHLHKANIDIRTDATKPAFFRSRHIVQQRLWEMQDAWMVRKVEELQGCSPNFPFGFLKVGSSQRSHSLTLAVWNVRSLLDNPRSSDEAKNKLYEELHALPATVPKAD
ncbi:unnamed protein product [Schistocephalus solidus]|uniref:Uncharacterized protein n=1 Tax=Schistocephalus solidus TaxID=70667 RepID=A0A183S7Y1_SCHSO|nr:unnamed protein product [Schistocephalus solidus]